MKTDEWATEGLPTGDTQLYKKSKGGGAVAGGRGRGPQNRAHQKQGRKAPCVLPALVFFSLFLFHAFNASREYGANRSSSGGGGGVVWVG